MADKQFFKLAGPFTLGQLADMTGSLLSDPAQASLSITDVAALDAAEKGQISFLDNKKYNELLKSTKASACFLRPEMAGIAPPSTISLTTKNPYKAYAIAAQAFYPHALPQNFRAPTAFIDSSASVGNNVSIGHGVFVGKNVKIGDDCRIHPNAVINDGVQIGNGCDIGAGVYISHALVADRVRIYPGAVIGRPGFGFAMDQSGFTSVPQLGRVIIESDVEIGANSTVDRGAGPDTVIGQGTRIDNLVQIGHNVKIGKFCVIVSQVGISGSTQIGDQVVIGGQAGFAGHIKVGSGARIGAQSGVLRDIDPGAEVMGTFAVPIKQFLRQHTILAKLATKKKESDE